MLLPLLLGAVLTIYGLFECILKPLYFSPLREIPAAHPSARFSSAWITLIRGPVVLIAPNELCVNIVNEGVRTIYAGGFEKDRYYEVFANYNNSYNMFSMLDSKAHSERKRMISHVYSKSALYASPYIAECASVILTQRLLPTLSKSAQEPVEVLSLLFGVGMDFITSFCFGLKCGTNFTQDPTYRNYWLTLYDRRNRRPFYLQNMPSLADFFSTLGIKPLTGKVTRANTEMEEWVLAMVDTIQTLIRDAKAEDGEGIVYRQLEKAISNDKTLNAASVRRKVASELMDHILAGHETTAIILTYVLYHLSKDKCMQEQLHQELCTIQEPSSDQYLLLAREELDKLPLLNAIMMETLRLNASIPGSQPRRTPKKGTRLGEFTNIPGNVRVSAQAYSLHREESVFPRPEEWRPSRWLDASEEQLKAQYAYFWAFGSGGRGCIGRNFAELEMKQVIASVYMHFRTGIVDDAGIEQADGYTVGPRSNQLWLSFERL